MKNRKGSAVTEFVFIMPFILLILVSLFQLYQISTSHRIQLVNNFDQIKKKLREEELQLSILDRPCVVHPVICEGRTR